MESPQQGTMEQPADSVVLEEEIDPNYVPSEQEVLEYVNWLGMDLEADKDLFWIAREGLMAPLPANWKPCKIKSSGDIYYFNFSTGESTWEHPCDEYYKRLYEEEKKKKEISLKESNDSKRAQAKQDIQTLIGKKEKKPKKSKPERVSLSEVKPEPLGPVLDRKPLPGLKLAAPIPASLGADLRNAPELGGPRDDPLARGPGLSPWQSESKLGPLKKQPLPDAKPQMKDIDQNQSEPEHMYPSKRDEITSTPSPRSDAAPENVVSTKSQRNFLAFRGHDEESQQKMIAANLRSSFEGEKKEFEGALGSDNNSREDLRAQIAQLEQENAKLLSKLAFHEIELKNCKSELDSMIHSLEKQRRTSEELQKAQSELISKEEDNYSLRSKIRGLELELSNCQDELQSKSVDLQRQKLRLQEDLDREKAFVVSLESRIQTLQSNLQAKESEIESVRRERVASSPVAASADTENHLLVRNNELTKELSVLQDSLQKLSREITILHDKIKEKNVELEELRSTLFEKDREMNELRNHLKLKESQLEEYQKKSLEKEHLKEKEIEQLRRELSDSQSNLARMENLPANDNQAEIMSLRQELAGKDFEKSHLSSQLEKKNEEVNVLSASLKNVQIELEMLKNQPKHVLSSNEIPKLHDEETELKLAQLQSKLKVSEEEAESLRGRLRTLNTEWEADISRRDSTMRLRLADLEREVEEWKRKHEILQNEMVKSTTSKNNMESLLALAEAKNKQQEEAKNKQAEEFSSRIKALEIEKEDLTRTLQLREESFRSSEERAKSLSKQLSDLLEREQRKEVSPPILSNSNVEDELREEILRKEEIFRNQRLQLDLLETERNKLSELLRTEEGKTRNMAKKEEESRSSLLRLSSLQIECAQAKETIQARENEILMMRKRLDELEMENAQFSIQSLQLTGFQDAIVKKDKELMKTRSELSESAMKIAVIQTELTTKQSEVDALQDVVKRSRNDVESLQKEVLRLKSELMIAASNSENDKSKLRFAELEIEHLNGLLQSKPSLNEAQDEEKERLRKRLKECDLEIEKKQRIISQLQSDLAHIQSENSNSQQLLSAERENGLQKDKKIRSFREELLQLQKRLSEREYNSSTKLPCTSVHVQTEGDLAPLQHLASSVFVQPKFHSQTQNDFGYSSQGTYRNAESMVQHERPTRQGDKLQENPEIPPEFDLRRVESTALVQLIKLYENGLLTFANAQPQSLAPTEVKSAKVPQREEPKILRDIAHKRERLYEDFCKQRDDVALDSEDIESDPGLDVQDFDSSDDLKSLSDLRSTTHALQHFSGDKLLENMSKMFSKLTSSIYTTRLRNMKSDRLMGQSLAELDMETTEHLLRQRLESEMEFVSKLTDMANRGKTFVRNGRSEIEKMKSDWKRSNGLSLDKGSINALTADLNMMVRFMRSVQSSIQVRSSLMKETKHHLAALFKRSHSSDKLRTVREKLALLDKDIVHLSEEIATLLQPIFSTPTPALKKRQKHLSSFDTLPPSHIQNFIGFDVENSWPIQAEINPLPFNPWGGINALQSSSGSSNRSSNNRLQEIQQQLSAAQRKQADSLKECDRHVSWLGNLMKEIDQTAQKGKLSNEGFPYRQATSQDNLLL